jgi:8-oxo-dGTP diphosphatase
METLKCACLFSQRGEQILLVRVRTNQHWYLPGGKIEPGETPAQTLARELKEELSLEIDPATVHEEFTVVGSAYDQPGDVELVCFSARWHAKPIPQQEITEVAWLGSEHYDLFAPAIKIPYDRRVRNARIRDAEHA